MYYHVILEYTNSSEKKETDHEIKSDLTDVRDVVSRFVDPYELGQPIVLNGQTYPIENVNRISIYKSEEPSSILVDQARIRHEQRQARDAASGIFAIYIPNYLYSAIVKLENITDQFITMAKGSRAIQSSTKSNADLTKVFIVHGHDDHLLSDVKTFLYSLGIEPLVLREQHDGSLTIIEKLEKHINDKNIGFGIILYTPDDEGKAVQESDLKYRARQNVVFEHGFLTGLYGRERVVCLVKKDENIELPGDVSGVVYADANAQNWRIGIAHSLNQAGYNIDFSKIRF
ncbi:MULTISPECIES: nucleotide-binding protein [Acinetobacter]|uniref:nucleotide-binding protein n=1 Tax=Acinetobacter TaxID=469 RepID=UPI0021CDCF75|nr:MULTISPECIES: nucleotide-binding protein [Acinetobacter]MCU4310315.1 nucleotide-binding protein [Acinetobacter radioresistens]